MQEVAVLAPLRFVRETTHFLRISKSCQSLPCLIFQVGNRRAVSDNWMPYQSLYLALWWTISAAFWRRFVIGASDSYYLTHSLCF